MKLTNKELHEMLWSALRAQWLDYLLVAPMTNGISIIRQKEELVELLYLCKYIDGELYDQVKRENYCFACVDAKVSENYGGLRCTSCPIAENVKGWCSNSNSAYFTIGRLYNLLWIKVIPDFTGQSVWDHRTYNWHYEERVHTEGMSLDEAIYIYGGQIDYNMRLIENAWK